MKNPAFTPPRCVFVTGPRGHAMARWLDERLAEIHAERPETRCAVLLADEGLTRTNRFANCSSPVAVRCLYLPCLCCPASADLPRIAREFAEVNRAACLFIELPALAAGGLISQFDHLVGWPREVVVCLNREWAKASRARTLSVFQTRLIALADQVVEMPPARLNSPPGESIPTLVLN